MYISYTGVGEVGGILGRFWEGFRGLLIWWRHTIRNCNFRYQSMDISDVLINNQDSRHFQLAICAVFHAESESAVRIDQFLHPGWKIKNNGSVRVTISYRKTSYCMSPP